MNLQETRRKLIHMLGGLGPPASVVLFGWTASVSILLFVTGYVFVGGRLNLRGVRLPIIAALIRHTQRHTERTPAAALEFLASILVLGLCFHEPLFFPAVALLAFGDGAAGLVGANLGRNRLPWNPRKSVEGLIAGVTAGILGALLLARIGEKVHTYGFETDPVVPDAWYVTATFLALGFVAVVYGTRFVMRLRRRAYVSNASGGIVAFTAAGCMVFALLPFVVESVTGIDGPLVSSVFGTDGSVVPSLYVALSAASMMFIESFLRRHDNLVLPLGFAALLLITVWFDPLGLGATP